MDKKLLKNVKMCLAKKNVTLNTDLLRPDMTEKTSKALLKIIYKTITSTKAQEHQKEGGKQTL